MLTLLGVGFAACQSEIDLPADEQGGIRVALENVSTAVVSRSTPAELGTPMMEAFHLSVVDAAGSSKYDGSFTTGVIHLPGGRYTVSATYGDNPLLDKDAPYYVGTTDVTVADDQVAEAAIHCTVGNALISVAFGKDEAERARFNKFYSSYSLNVCLDGYKSSISNFAPKQSVYFRAGSSVSLEFEGVLAGNGQSVSTTLDVSGVADFPKTFKAADHAIVTLTLPDPETAAIVDISKVELVKATLENTIPVSWLPLPTPNAEHRYNDQGELVGTDVKFNDTYPGMEWQAVVTGKDGSVYRTVSGKGALNSDYASNAAAWPYLPAGNYTATYTVTVDGKAQSMGSRDFSVSAPALRLTPGGYTSYSKYLEGDVDAANACDAYSAYALSAKLNVAQSLLANAKYSTSASATFNGSNIAGTQNGNTFVYGNKTDLAPSFNAYKLNCSATFDNTTVSASHDLFITGLPVEFSPPTREAGWTAHGTVAWGDADGTRIRLGQNTVSNPHSVENNKFAVPAGVKIEAPYDVVMHPATENITLTLSFGDTNYFEVTEKKIGAFSFGKDIPYQGSAIFTTSAPASLAKASHSQGVAQNRSYIYTLSYKYAK